MTSGFAPEGALASRLLDAIDAAVIATTLEGVVTHWNGAAERMYGWRRDEALGLPITRLTVSAARTADAGRVMEALRREGRWRGEFEVSRRDGSTFPAMVHNVLLRDDAGAPAGIAGVSMDISSRVQAERQLRAARDHLEALADSMGEGLLTVDPEGRVTYLNRAAEQLLGWRGEELVGRPLHETVHAPPEDGTPFAEADRALAQARRAGVRMSADDEAFVRRDGSLLPVAYTTAPLSAGGEVTGQVVVFRDDRARRAGQDRLRRAARDRDVLDRVRAALARKSFVMFAQPIVRAGDRALHQHELLIRLRDLDGRLLPPSEFLPVAERYGVVPDIDRWVIRMAAGLAAADHPVEINLSAETLADPGVFRYLERALEEAGAPPRLLVVELTETAVLRDESAARFFTDQLRRLGCRFALDDFGAGYGGFTYLKRLSIDYLKIDREFTRDLANDAGNRHVVRAVVDLARGFHVQTVAEGVEDEETARALAGLGVDLLQGYALGRPGPLREVLGLGDRLWG